MEIIDNEAVEVEITQGDGRTSTKGQRLRVLLRQNSEKIGYLAEDVILPKHKRSLKIKPSGETVALDVENQQVQRQITPVQKFPIFMVLISFFQAVLFYLGGPWLWLYLCYDPFRRHEIWRFFTIMLVHNSSVHLWGNVGLQLILGVLLEIVHHWKRIGTIYLASVLGGTLFITVLSPTVYGVGASAGVYGLLFAHLATIILNWNEMDRKCCRVFWLLAYMAFDFGLSAYIKFGLKLDTNTSHAGHIGGAVTGFLTSVLVLKNFEKHPWEKVVQKICGGILITLAVLIVLTNLFVSSLYYPSAFNMDYEDTFLQTVYKIIAKSSPDSDMRKICESDAECKEGLRPYLNGTLHSG